ncbi:MAG: PD40 domain-containing protein [Bryobacterales bacterium]|nr:PD40 domain-containing protein [Bryobacterales bacterium]
MFRREFLASMALLPLSGAAKPVPVRAITQGPKHHWFGYYDKLEFDPGSRYVLGMEVDFEHRSPLATDKIKVGMVDTQDGDRWIELGETTAWNWQQGCMLQWLPNSKDEVLWNDRGEGDFVCHILNVRTRKKRTIPSAIYALSPDAKWAITCDFRRLNDKRPGYGYSGIPDPNKEVATPEDIGIWKVDLATGKRKLLISIADAARIPYPGGYSKGALHWFNHLLVSPDGKRFIFLHRWRGEKEGAGFSTRMFTASADGKDLHVLDPHGKTSHFIWRDSQHVLAWAWHPSDGDKFYVYRDRTSQVEVIGKGVMLVNGHCTYLPGNRWILNDTYPDKERLQHVYLFDTKTGERHPLGDFHSPKEYAGEWRCDTHPRFSPDGKKVVIDSPHGGTGRQLHLLDISAIVG